MFINISQIKLFLDEYDQQKSISRQMLGDPSFILALRAFVKNHTPDTALDCQQFMALTELCSKHMYLLKEKSASSSIFCALLASWGIDTDRWPAIAPLLPLLNKGGLLTESVLTWVVSLNTQLTDELKTMLMTLDKQHLLERDYLPLFIGCPLFFWDMPELSDKDVDNIPTLVAQLFNAMNSPELTERVTRLRAMKEYYTQHDTHPELFCALYGSRRAWWNIDRFFMMLHREGFLTPETFNAILSSFENGRAVYSRLRKDIDITVIILLDSLCRAARGTPLMALFAQHAMPIIQLFVSRPYCFNVFHDIDANHFARVVIPYLNALQQHSSIEDLYFGLCQLDNALQLTADNVAFISDEPDCYLTHHLSDEQVFFRRIVLTQEPCSVVEFDEHGHRKTVVDDGSDRKRFLMSRLISFPLFSKPLEPNEMLSIKQTLREDDLLLMLDMLLEKPSDCSSSKSKATLLVFLAHYHLDTPENRQSFLAQSDYEKLSDFLRAIQTAVGNNDQEPEINMQQVFNAALHHGSRFAQPIITFLGRVPRGCLTQTVFDQIFQYCAEAQDDPLIVGRQLTALCQQIQEAQEAHWRAQYLEYLGEAPRLTPQGPVINYAQSTHDEQVHASVSQSVQRLMNRYGEQINTATKLQGVLNDVIRWGEGLQDLGSGDLQMLRWKREKQHLIEHVPLAFKASVAKRALTRNPYVLDPNFVDRASKISMQQMVALYWIAAHDIALINQNKMEGEPPLTVKDTEALLIEALYEIQREYGFDNFPLNSENFYERGGLDHAICVGGTFNKWAEKLQTVHPDVEVIVSDYQVALLKFPIVVRQITQCHLHDTCQQQSCEEAMALLRQIETEGLTVIWGDIEQKVKAEMLAEFPSIEHRLAEFMSTGVDVDVSSIITDMIASQPLKASSSKR